MNGNVNARREAAGRRGGSGRKQQQVTLTKILMLVLLATLIMGGLWWWRNRNVDEAARTRPEAERVMERTTAPGGPAGSLAPTGP